MESNGVFRSALFGGYNKDDVNSYVLAMENDIKESKSRYENELAELRAKLQSILEEKQILVEQIQCYDGKKTVAEIKEKHICEKKLEEKEKENKQLRRQIDEIKTENNLLTQKKETLEKEVEQLKVIKASAEEGSRLEEEVQSLAEKKAKYEEEYKAVTRVLEDARKIEENAKKQAEELLLAAQKESEALKERLKTQIDKELEDKGIRLMAAKYKIEAYRKEINTTQQKLYNLYSDMGKLVEHMPQCLEHLWDDDAYSKLLFQAEEAEKTDDDEPHS